MLVGTYVVIRTYENIDYSHPHIGQLRKQALREHYEDKGSPRFHQWITFIVNLARNWPEDKEYSLRDHTKVVERYLDNSHYPKHCFLKYEAFFEDFIVDLPDCALIKITGTVPMSPSETCNIPSVLVKQFGIVERYGQIGQDTVVQIENVNDEKSCLNFEEIEKGFQFKTASMRPTL